MGRGSACPSPPALGRAWSSADGGDGSPARRPTKNACLPRHPLLSYDVKPHQCCTHAEPSLQGVTEPPGPPPSPPRGPHRLAQQEPPPPAPWESPEATGSPPARSPASGRPGHARHETRLHFRSQSRTPSHPRGRLAGGVIYSELRPRGAARSSVPPPPAARPPALPQTSRSPCPPSRPPGPWPGPLRSLRFLVCGRSACARPVCPSSPHSTLEPSVLGRSVAGWRPCWGGRRGGHGRTRPGWTCVSAALGEQ